MRKYYLKIIVFIVLIAVFQFVFPQHSYAYTLGLGRHQATKNSLLAVANSPQLIMFDLEKSNNQLFGGLPIIDEREPRKTVRVWVTAYSSTPDQTDDSPFITANGSRVKDGIIAANFLAFGTHVKMPEVFGNKTFIVQDRMNVKHANQIDIWMPTREAAVKFGAQLLEVEIF